MDARANRFAVAYAVVIACAVASSGCLGEPKLEDRWTRVDFVGSNLATGQQVQAGSAMPVTMSADIYYRRILTGYAVAELRASTTLSSASLAVRPDNDDRLRMANDIDRLLATSVSMGRQVRAITGWDHLIQRIDFGFTGAIPGSVTDSLGTGPTAGLFLVCYLGSGRKIELADGTDSVAVTPFVSNAYEILPVGLPLTVVP